MCLAFAGVAHLVERDLAKVEVASSSLVARSKKKTPSVRMVFSFWNVAGRLELAASTCAKRVKSRGKGRVPANGSAIRGMPGASSSLVARSKKERHPHGCLSFLEQHFCYAKVVACGRVTEREWGNPSKVPSPRQVPPLRVGCAPKRALRGAALTLPLPCDVRECDSKTCGQAQKGNHPNGVVFLFGKSLSKMNRTRIAKIRLQAVNPWDDHVRSSKRPRLLPGSLLL